MIQSRKFFILQLLSVTALILSSCAQNPAEIEYHINDFYGYVKNGNTEKVPQKKYSAKRVFDHTPYKVDSYREPENITVETVNENLGKEDEQILSKNNTKANPSNIGRKKLIRVSGKTHVVKKQETLYAISRKYNIPILPIIIVNKLKSPYELKENQRIKIPEANFHLVSKGETLYGISRAYNVDLPSIVMLNQLSKPYQLYQGQKVQIPFPTTNKKGEKKAYDRLAKDTETKIDNTVFISDRGPLPKRPLGLAIEISPTNKPAEFKSDKITKKSNKQVVPRTNRKVISSRKREAIRKITAAKYKDDGKFIWPVKGKLIANFGKQKNNEYNDGIYISANKGKEVLASLSGRVVYVGDSLKSYGNLVIIKHSNGLLSAYAHLDKTTVKKDSQIAKGDIIGTVGQTGKVENPQLYFAIRKGKEAKDPIKYLKTSL